MAKAIENSCPVPAGILIIIGGAESKGGGPENHDAPEGYHPLDVLKCFTGLLRRKDATIEIITSASSEGVESIRQYKRLFKKLGIENIQHMHHKSRTELLEDDLEQRVRTV